MPVAFEIFERGVRIYADAAKAGAIALGVSPTGSARLIGLDNNRFEEMAKKSEISEGDLDATRVELEEALTAHSVEVAVETFVSTKLQHQKGTGQDPDSAEVLARKYDLVGEIFDVGPLRQRAWGKFSSKLLNFGRLDWEIVSKRIDDDYPRPEGDPLPLAQIELRAWGPKTGEEGRSDRILFAMDDVDLEVMIEGLTRLRKAFRENGGTVGNG
jgi:hypothetical protein